MSSPILFSWRSRIIIARIALLTMVGHSAMVQIGGLRGITLGPINMGEASKTTTKVKAVVATPDTAGSIHSEASLASPTSSDSGGGILATQQKQPVANSSSPARATYHVDSGGGVHIVYAADTDSDIFTAFSASARSIITNTRTPSKINIHVFVLKTNNTVAVEGENASTATAKTADPILFNLKKYIERSGARLHIHQYIVSEVEPFINKHSTGRKGALKSPGNYVRFILVDRLDLLISNCLWIDSDTIVKGDIVPFLEDRQKKSALTNKGVSAFPRYFKSEDVKALSNWKRNFIREHGIDVPEPFYPTFNAGIMVLNLQYFRQHNASAQLRQICKLNNEHNLYPGFGSQPPLQLLFSGPNNFEQLSEDLVVGNLGFPGHHDLEQKKQQIASNSTLFLHWNGPNKPWEPQWGRYKYEWEPYNNMSIISQ